MSVAATIQPDLAGLLPDEATDVLRAHFAGRGQPKYRAAQVVKWVFERLAGGFDEMTDLPAPEREALGEAGLRAHRARRRQAVALDRRHRQEPVAPG